MDKNKPYADIDLELYSLQEVAKKLRVSERTVFRYIHEGKLRATKIGYWRITKEDLKAFLTENSNVATQMYKKEIYEIVKPKKSTKTKAIKNKK